MRLMIAWSLADLGDGATSARPLFFDGFENKKRQNWSKKEKKLQMNDNITIHVFEVKILKPNSFHRGTPWPRHFVAPLFDNPVWCTRRWHCMITPSERGCYVQIYHWTGGLLPFGGSSGILILWYHRLLGIAKWRWIDLTHNFYLTWYYHADVPFGGSSGIISFWYTAFRGLGLQIGDRRLTRLWFF